MSSESTLNVRTAQRELRELADRLDSTANVAGYACELGGMLHHPDRSKGIEQHMRTVTERTKSVLHDLQLLVERLEQIQRWSD